MGSLLLHIHVYVCERGRQLQMFVKHAAAYNNESCVSAFKEHPHLTHFHYPLTLPIKIMLKSSTPTSATNNMDYIDSYDNTQVGQHWRTQSTRAQD